MTGPGNLIQSVIVLLALCAANQVPQPAAAHQAGQEGTCAEPVSCWHKLDAGPFSISAPPGWAFHQSMGVDSYVGEFAGDGFALTFDLGRYSGDYLKNAKKPDYSVTKKSIGGRSARVVNPLDQARGITGVYIKLGRRNALCVWAKNLSAKEQNVALRMFDTIQFGGPIPPTVVLPPPPPAKQ